jgi:RNA polymerase sigma factor (sigma-70 family)
MTNDDMALVREYAASHSEKAFEEIVQRHVPLVYSAALRRVGEAHLAEEITQAVFIILARKAGSLGPKTILSGWLYRATGYTSADALKSRRRRQQREQEAYMQSLLEGSSDDDSWKQIGPLLEAAMDSLFERDRDALVLRFFEGKTLDEVGSRMGTSEDAAKKRVERALERLRNFFSKRGVNSTTDAIAKAVCAYSIQPAPGVLAKSVLTAAIAKGAGAASASGGMNWSWKFAPWAKIAIGIGAASFATVGASSITYHWFEPAHESLDDKIAELSIPGTTLKEAISVLGTPRRYWFGAKTLDKNHLPAAFLVTFPHGIQAFVWKNLVRKWEAVGKPGFSVNGLHFGSTLDDVLAAVGPPTEIVTNGNGSELAGRSVGGYGGIFYQDMDGKPGFDYYWRPDQNLRFIFRQEKVTEIVIEVPNSGR